MPVGMEIMSFHQLYHFIVNRATDSTGSFLLLFPTSCLLYWSATAPSGQLEGFRSGFRKPDFLHSAIDQQGP